MTNEHLPNKPIFRLTIHEFLCFATYGSCDSYFFSFVCRYYSVPEEERFGNVMNPMCNVFPRIAACDYIR